METALTRRTSASVSVFYIPIEQHFVLLNTPMPTDEVLANLQMLYNNLDADVAVYNFTIEQAAQAICSYDTEYRETICEQFEDCCNEAAEVANANFATLALRIMYNY